MNLERHLLIAKEIAIKAGIEIMKIYNTDFDASIRLKEDSSPLTDADMAANDLIVETLSREFPEISILAEESKTDKSRFSNDWCWIVDPLDGTKEFIKRNGEFTVNIALSYKGKSILGVVYVPVTGHLYYGAEGIGSYSLIDGVVKRLHVTDKLDNLISVESKSHMSEKLKELKKTYGHLIGDSISRGSSLKGLMIAEGSADIYYRFGYTSQWDTAAMQCIVEEAGGIFMQMDKTEMIYNRRETLNEKGFFVVNRRENIWV